MALTPFQLRALCERSPVVRTSTRIVPWQPASIEALLGSMRIAKSACSRSGSLSVSLRRPLWTESTSSAS